MSGSLWSINDRGAHEQRDSFTFVLAIVLSKYGSSSEFGAGLQAIASLLASRDKTVQKQGFSEGHVCPCVDHFVSPKKRGASLFGQVLK